MVRAGSTGCLAMQPATGHLAPRWPSDSEVAACGKADVRRFPTILKGIPDGAPEDETLEVRSWSGLGQCSSGQRRVSGTSREVSGRRRGGRNRGTVRAGIIPVPAPSGGAPSKAVCQLALRLALIHRVVREEAQALRLNGSLRGRPRYCGRGRLRSCLPGAEAPPPEGFAEISNNGRVPWHRQQ